MINVVLFLGGALASAVGLGIGFYSYLMRVRANEKKVNRERTQLSNGLRDLRKGQRDLSEKESAHVSFQSLKSENDILKRDLLNLAIAQKKGDEDNHAIELRQGEIEEYSNAIAERYLKDNVRWVSDKVNANNYCL